MFATIERVFGRIGLVLLVALFLWAVFVRPSQGASPERVYVVKPHDTLWAIAASRYAGDPREAVWRLQERNGLPTAMLVPGQRLVLPSPD
jgi:nucleoid-associated protein YgaU